MNRVIILNDAKVQNGTIVLENNVVFDMTTILWIVTIVLVSNMTTCGSLQNTLDC